MNANVKDFKQEQNGEVTRLLQRLKNGEDSAASSLLEILYQDLRRVASVRMADERSSHTFQPTDLVHEAYMRLVGEDHTPQWNSRRHFFSAAAEAMRRILIDHVRKKKTSKHGGEFNRVGLPSGLIPDERRAEQLLALNDALISLEQEYPKKAELVKLRFFGGLTIDQAAEALGISTTTADRHWAFARAWLKTEIKGDVEL